MGLGHTTRPLSPHTEAWLDKQKADEQAAIDSGRGLRRAREQVDRDGWVPKKYCAVCGARNPQYNQLCGWASWHVERDWPDE